MQINKQTVLKLSTVMLLAQITASQRVFAAGACNNQPIAVGVECTDKTNVIYSYLGGIVKFLSAGVGIVVVLMIVVSGIQYITSSGDPQATASAKNRLVNALIALLLFIFMTAILNYIIPGGPTMIEVFRIIAVECGENLFFGLPRWSKGLNFDDQCNIIDFNLGQVWLVVANLVQIALGLAALLSVIFIIVGGITYITSQGNPENTKRAQDIITNAVIGLVIAILASAIVGFIAGRFVNA